jgi:hypothetical protein
MLELMLGGSDYSINFLKVSTAGSDPHLTVLREE